jgi:O-antigen/teichoic acid export membrane protein
LSLKRNIAANYVSQIYVTLTGILILPLYIKYMGAEAYGLVGFFTMLQAWFNLLDLGLTPTIGRETARYHGGAMPALQYIQFYRALSIIFATIALVGGSVLFIMSSQIATHWLHIGKLPLSDVILSLKIMATCIALRWMGGLYRGIVTGSERLVWLSGFTVVLATLRFIVVLPVMWHFGFTPYVFFVYQMVVALFEFSCLGLKSFTLLPRHKGLGQAIGWSFKPIQPLLKFALTIAFTSAVWVFVTQTDKLVLSGILSLSAYGYFTLAVLVAGGIMVVSGPVSIAIMPRMARLHSEGHHEELIRVYRNATQLVAIVAGSAAITIVCCAYPLLYAWTGDHEIASQAAPILKLYAIGNGFLAVGAFPYYLQYAKGNLKYHLMGNCGLVLVLVPCIVLVAQHYGGVGAGFVWAIMNGLYLLLWVAFVHHKLEKNLHKVWFIDILRVIVPAIIVAIIFMVFNITVESRLESLIYVVFCGILILISTILFSSIFSNKIRGAFKW